MLMVAKSITKYPRFRRFRARHLRAASGQRWGILTALSYLTNDGGDFGIALIDQALLTEQSILNLARKPEPFFAWPRAEVAE
jgi:hypothetical protein